ncbi:MAG TPA: hypothetical protein VFJ19_09430 [Nocardioidaceae bacterium]|nr:hypothetical protein [Nocardioidaceae bacterium]
MAESADYAAGRTHYCSQCDEWTDHRDYAHDLCVCSCGNRFDGDNLCTVSACQGEE